MTDLLESLINVADEAPYLAGAAVAAVVIVLAAAIKGVIVIAAELRARNRLISKTRAVHVRTIHD
jgi:hypothetical protein